MHTPHLCSCGLMHSVPGAAALNAVTAQSRGLPPDLQGVLSAAVSAASPVAAALIAAIRRLIADKDAEIDALRAELDERGGRVTLVCMERDAELMMSQAADDPPGTILRSTDTGTEWEKHLDGWALR